MTASRWPSASAVDRNFQRFYLFVGLPSVLVRLLQRNMSMDPGSSPG